METGWAEHANRMARMAGGVQRVQILSGDGTAGPWVEHRPGQPAHHQLRTVLPQEIVYDLGDHEDWMLCRDESHALWFALNRLGLPYVGGLSAGVGTHTHLLGPPQSEWGDWRNAASGMILDLASQFLSQMRGEFTAIQADYRLLAPSADSRMCREFGRSKTPLGPTKRVWVEGPGFFMPLPDTREKAYAKMTHLYPNGSLRPAPELASFDRSAIVELFGVSCPQGPGCIEKQCDGCPMRGLC